MYCYNDYNYDSLATITAVKFVVHRDVYVMCRELTNEMKLYFQQYPITMDIFQLPLVNLFSIQETPGHMIITCLHELKFSRESLRVASCLLRLKKCDRYLYACVAHYIRN